GTSHTGRIITAAALILIVVTGAFAFSDLVMMKYIAYGMIAALIIDATLIRMFLVPATMKLLGDDCWWAPQWMKRIQRKLGLGETILEDELLPIADVPELALAGGAPSTKVAPPIRPAPRRSEPLTEPIPVVAPHGSGPIRATHAAKEESRRTVTGRPATPPEDEPTRATQAAPAPRRAPEPAPSRPVPPRPTVEPEPTQAADVVRPASPADSDAAPPSARPPRPSSAPRPPVAPPSRSRVGRAPRAEEPDSRSIESWLADLRAPSASPPSSRPSSTSTGAGAGRNGSHNGSTAEGTGQNETGYNGSVSEDAGHNGRAENGSSQNGSPRNGYVSNASGRNGTNGSERNSTNGSGRNSTNGSGRTDTEQNGSEHNSSEHNSSEYNGSGHTEPTPSESPKPSGRRAAPSTEGGDSGRHRGGENGQVVSVSELIARERNRSR
ncbi:MMPL family transporter, partial [Rhodococcus sp. MALMAid1271]|uniref:MMPL family transporter n=1 Tax=Rhodococcus sp. MALMAid1271 TaxID=3411744 RepID=UPI003B9E5AF9